MNKQEDFFDRRVLGMYLREGTVTEEEYNKFLKTLPDKKNDMEWMEMEEVAPLSYLRALGIEKGKTKEDDSRDKNQKKK